jgi:flagellar M-ring protein FliF
MDVINSFRALTRGRQALLVGGALLFLGAIFALLYVLLRQTYEPLFTNLRPAEAAPIVAELDKRKVPYRLEDRGGTIMVPSKLADRTRLGVTNEDLPLKGGVGFELFNKSDMGLTEFAQKINYQRALQGELARTIMTMDGVDSARVHLSIPEPTLFRDERKSPKASVTIMTRRGRSLAAGTVAGVQKLVAAAVSDLNVEDVVVLNEAGAIVSGASAAANLAVASTMGIETPGLQARQAIELYYEALVRNGLQGAAVSPETDVAVAADVPPPR